MILLLVATRYEIGETARLLRREIAKGQVAIREIGVGPVRARQHSTKWLEAVQPDWVLSVGFSAGLHPQLKGGDVRVSEELRAWGEVAAMQRVDRILQSPEDKAAVFRESGAELADMESVAVREIAGQCGVRFGSIRVISDDAMASLPLPAENLFNLESGGVAIGSLLGYLLTHPTKILGFIRFVQGCRHAERKLSLTTSAVVKALLGSP